MRIIQQKKVEGDTGTGEKGIGMPNANLVAKSNLISLIKHQFYEAIKPKIFPLLSSVLGKAHSDSFEWMGFCNRL